MKGCNKIFGYRLTNGKLRSRLFDPEEFPEGWAKSPEDAKEIEVREKSDLGKMGGKVQVYESGKLYSHIKGDNGEKEGYRFKSGSKKDQMKELEDVVRKRYPHYNYEIHY